MSDQKTRAKQFTELHKKGDPVIIYNAWDGGSAKAIEDAGARAIATGDHPVGFSHGYTSEDFNEFTFDLYMTTIKDIARVVEVPFSVDISSGEGLILSGLKDRVKMLLKIGVVGINFEDRLDDSSGIKHIEEQVERIKAIRETSEEFGVPLFINARSDIFSTAKSKDEHAGLIDRAVERAKAYKEAGGSGFFVPGLVDIELIKKLCEQSELPVNIIRIPGAPSTKELAEAGVGRISYGPVVQLQMIEWLKKQAILALNGEI
jgi:2-methylisocitrate lyase-like PEP mutase family enzyme